MTGRPTLGVFGCFQNGKSTLVNCLLDGLWSATGSGLPTTKLNTWYRYGQVDTAEIRRRGKENIALRNRAQLHDAQQMQRHGLNPAHDEIHAETWRPLLQNTDILDTPGVNHDSADNATALAGLDQVDAAVIVLTNGRELAKPDLALLDACTERNTPFAVIVNCKDGDIDRADPAADANQSVYSAIRDRLNLHGHKPIPIGDRTDGLWPCNLLWAAESLGHLEQLQLNSGDTGADAIAKRRRIQRFFQSEKNSPIPDCHTLFRLSGLLPIRVMLEHVAWIKLDAPSRQRETMLVEGWRGSMLRAVRSSSSTKPAEA